MNPFLSFDPFVFFDTLLLFFLLFFLFPQGGGKRISRGIFLFLNASVFSLFPKLSFKGAGLWGFLFSLFSFFLLINLLSLWSYIITPTANLIITLSFGTLLWLGVFISQGVSFFSRKLEHFVPQGTPLWLLPLIIFIEVISQLIRPITLRVRLAANLTAGHLILSLLSSLSLTQGLVAQLPLLLLEVLVAVVQPFVFCMLLFLYFSEN